MQADPLVYLTDAVDRIEQAGLATMAGSHVAGIFGRAANGFEKEIRSYVERLLKNCDLDYRLHLRRCFPGRLLAILLL